MDFENKLVQWDGMSVDMKVYERSYERKFGDGTKLVDLTMAEKLFYDAMEEDLEDDDTLPTCDMTDDGSLDDDLLESEIGNDHADMSMEDEGV